MIIVISKCLFFNYIIILYIQVAVLIGVIPIKKKIYIYISMQEFDLVKFSNYDLSKQILYWKLFLFFIY